jgi:hypothetical protein
MIRLYSLQDKLRSEENASTYLEDVTIEDIEVEYSKIGEKPTNNINNYSDKPISENKEDEIRRATHFVSLLSPSRCDTFESWIRIGWALHNIDNSMLNTWIDFSKN